VIAAALATIPERWVELQAVLKALRPQVDKLYVCLNGHDEVPPIVKLLADDFVLRDNDLGDAGKFYWAHHTDADWCLTCDDDFDYSPTYVEHMIAAASRLGRRAAVSLHGVVLSEALARGDDTDWLKHGRSQWVRTIDSVKDDMPVHLAGTGVLCYPNGLIKLSIDDFPVSNMADVWFARACKAQGVPRYAVAHEPGLVKPLAPPCLGGPSRRRMDGDYAKHIREVAPWTMLT
jgi:hypothetical protein